MTPEERAEHDRKLSKAIARIKVERKAAGVCRHCGGPVPCSSLWGDVRVGVRRSARARGAAMARLLGGSDG